MFGCTDLYGNHKVKTVKYVAICVRFLIPHLATSDIYAQYFFLIKLLNTSSEN